jgi:hypothetical protein
MAASAKMSFNYYQNGKYGTLPSNPQKEMEVTNDMHLKMYVFYDNKDINSRYTQLFNY